MVLAQVRQTPNPTCGQCRRGAWVWPPGPEQRLQCSVCVRRGRACGALSITTAGWRAAEHTNPKQATLAWDHFWAEGNWEEADTGKALCPLPAAEKQDMNLKRCPLPSPPGKTEAITGDNPGPSSAWDGTGGNKPSWNHPVYHQFLYICLPTTCHPRNPKSLSFVLSLPYKFPVLCSDATRAQVLTTLWAHLSVLPWICEMHVLINACVFFSFESAVSLTCGPVRG